MLPGITSLELDTRQKWLSALRDKLAFDLLFQDPRWKLLTGLWEPDAFVPLEEAWHGYTADEALALAECRVGGFSKT